MADYSVDDILNEAKALRSTNSSYSFGVKITSGKTAPATVRTAGTQGEAGAKSLKMAEAVTGASAGEPEPESVLRRAGSKDSGTQRQTVTAAPAKKPETVSSVTPEQAAQAHRAKAEAFTVTLPTEAVSKPSPYERRRLEDTSSVQEWGKRANARRPENILTPEEILGKRETPEGVVFDKNNPDAFLDRIKTENPVKTVNKNENDLLYRGDTIHASLTENPAAKKVSPSENRAAVLPEREGETIHAPVVDKKKIVTIEIPKEEPGEPVSIRLDVESLPGQQTLSGYEPVAKDKEIELRSELAVNRRKKVREFMLSGDVTEDYEETEPSGQEDEPEDYRGFEDAKKIKIDIISRIRVQNRSLWLTVIFTLLELAVTVLGRMGKLGDLFSPEANPAAFICVVGILFICMVLVNAASIFGGLGSLFRLRPDVDSPVGLAALFTAGQTVLFAVMPDAFNIQHIELLAGGFGLALTLNILGKLSMLRRINRNFRHIANRRSKQYACRVENEDDALAFGNGISYGAPTVSVDREAVDLQNFLAYSYEGSPADSVAEKSPWIVLIIAAAAIGLTIVLGDHAMSIPWMVSCAAWVMLFVPPFSALIAGNIPLSRTARSLEKHGAMLAGYEAAERFSDPDVITLDASELFPKGTVQLCSAKVYGTKPLEEVLLSAAGVAINAGGPLAPVFETVIEGKKSMLPKVDTLVYEESMGISGWVNGDRVLVGNRTLLKNHSVRVLDRETEDGLCADGKQLLYLSCDGELSAVFVLRYLSDERAAVRLRSAVRRGARILVSSCDQNVNSALISECYEIPEQAVTLMNTATRKLYRQYTAPSRTGDALLVHGNTLYSRLMALLACRRLLQCEKTAAVMTVVAMVFGAVLSGGAIYLGLTCSSLCIVGWQLVCALLTCIIPAVIRPD